MAETPQDAGNAPPWQSGQAPCVYCGQVVDRSADRCPHCRTSYSVAVRKASREVLGPWYYLDPRNPSGRGVTLETLLKMLEKGRLRPDSIVRGPTTHQDWMYAAETPRLAKYFGLCPHCFAKAKPEDTYCTHCQLNMNQRLTEPRPGIPSSLVKAPFHAAAHEVERLLAEADTPAPAGALGDATRVTPVTPGAPTPSTARSDPTPRHSRPEPAPAATRMAAAVSAMRTTGPAAQRRRPKPWVVFALTWATLIPLFFIAVYTPLPLWFVPASWEPSLRDGQRGIRDSIAGLFGAHPSKPAETTAQTPPDETWMNEQLTLADQAERAGEYDRAIVLLQEAADRSTDTVTVETLKARISALRHQIEVGRKAHLEELTMRLTVAKKMADRQDFASALDVLRNVGEIDRRTLAAAGVSVERMEVDFQNRQKQLLAEKEKQQIANLKARLAQAAEAAAADRLEEAIDAYTQIASAFPAALVAKQAPDLGTVVKKLKARLAAKKTPPTEPPATPPTPPSDLTPEETAAAVADLVEQSLALEKQTKFVEAIQRLESIKQFDRAYWPENLESRIKELKDREEARKFYGIE